MTLNTSNIDRFFKRYHTAVLAKNKEYQVTTEKKKEYAKIAYLNKKAKIKKELEQNETPSL